MRPERRPKDETVFPGPGADESPAAGLAKQLSDGRVSAWTGPTVTKQAGQEPRMITEDQSEVVAFLTSPSTHAGTAVERIDTHASLVFLAGTRAWKLKRAVRYDYLDFSTEERRKTMCEAEVRIN